MTDKYAKLRPRNEPVRRNPCCYDRLGNAKSRWRSLDAAQANCVKYANRKPLEPYECSVVSGTFHVRSIRK